MGLPFGAFFLLFVVAGAFGLVLHSMRRRWSLGRARAIAAAITRYDPWGFEIMLGAYRLPRVLKAV